MSRKNYELGFFGDPFFDDFDNFFDLPKTYHRYDHNMLKTDIKEFKDNYVIDIDVPGVKKENINLKLNNGYLEITATVKEENDDNSEKSKYLRKERFYGSMSRSFYIGEDYKQKDISASFKDGVLSINLPKLEKLEKPEEPERIEIQ